MSDEPKNEAPDYCDEPYGREERDFETSFQRFCDYYGNNRRG